MRFDKNRLAKCDNYVDNHRNLNIARVDGRGIVTDRNTSLVEGEKYILTLEIRTEHHTAFNYNYYMDDVNGNDGSFPSVRNVKNDGKWHKYKLDVISSVTSDTVGVMIADSSNKPFEIRKLKLEKGNKGTDWSPAPEDMFSEIEKKADGDTVYTIKDVDNMINNTVSITEYATDMNDVVQDISDQNTRIGQNETAIGLRAKTSDLNAVENSLNTKIGNVEVKADAVEISVGEVKANLNGMEIGGENYLIGTGADEWAVYAGNPKKTVSYEDKTPIIRVEATKSGRFGVNQSTNYQSMKLKTGVQYTFSMYVRGNIPFIPYTYIMNKGIGVGNMPFPSIPISSETEFNKVSILYTPNSNADLSEGSYLMLSSSDTGISSGDWFEFYEVKIEKGNKATDWSPAPEDVDGAINQVSGRVETLDGEIKAVAGEVSLKANQSIVDSLENRVSDAETELIAIPGKLEIKANASDVYNKSQTFTKAEVNASFDAVNTQIELKVDDGDARTIFLQEANAFTFDAAQVNFTGHAFGKDATFEGKLAANEGFFGDNIRLRDGKLEIVRPDGAISMTSGMIDTGYTVTGNDPQFMGSGRSSYGATFPAFAPGGDDEAPGHSTSVHIYGRIKGKLDGRENNAGVTYTDARDSMGAIAVQKYHFIHSARFLVFAFRKYAGSKFSVHVMNNSSANLDDRLFFKMYEKDTAGLDYLVVDLGKPLYNKKTVTFKIGWTNGWGPGSELIRFIMENVYLTDFE